EFIPGGNEPRGGWSPKRRILFRMRLGRQDVLRLCAAPVLLHRDGLLHLGCPDWHESPQHQHELPTRRRLLAAQGRSPDRLWRDPLSVPAVGAFNGFSPEYVCVPEPGRLPAGRRAQQQRDGDHVAPTLDGPGKVVLRLVCARYLEAEPPSDTECRRALRTLPPAVYDRWRCVRLQPGGYDRG